MAKSTNFMKRTGLALAIVAILAGQAPALYAETTGDAVKEEQQALEETAQQEESSSDKQTSEGKAESTSISDKIKNMWKSFKGSVSDTTNTAVKKLKIEEYKTAWAVATALVTLKAIEYSYQKAKEKAVIANAERTPEIDELERIDAQLENPNLSLEERASLDARRQIVLHTMIVNFYGDKNFVQSLVETIKALTA